MRTRGALLAFCFCLSTLTMACGPATELGSGGSGGGGSGGDGSGGATASGGTGGTFAPGGAGGAGGGECTVNEVPLVVSWYDGVPDRFFVPVRRDGADAMLLFDTGSALTFVRLE